MTSGVGQAQHVLVSREVGCNEPGLAPGSLDAGDHCVPALLVATGDHDLGAVDYQPLRESAADPTYYL